MAHDPFVFGAQIGAMSKQAGPISETLAFARPDNLLGGAAALMTPTRTLAQQANHDANDGMGRTLANLFVPGVGAYNAYKRMGASMRSPEMKKLQLQQQGRPMPQAPAAPATSMLGEKKSFMAGGALGALGGLASLNKETPTVPEAAQAAGRGGLIGAAAQAAGRKGMQLGERIAFNGRLVAPLSQVRAGRVLGALAGGLGGGLASRGAIDTLRGENNDVLRGIGKAVGPGLGGLVGGAVGGHVGGIAGTAGGFGAGKLLGALLRKSPYWADEMGQTIAMPLTLALGLGGLAGGAHKGYNAVNKLVSEKKSFMVGGTVGALGGLATSKKNKRGLGAGRGALIGGGTELGVYPGAAVGGLSGLALARLISGIAGRSGSDMMGDMLTGGAAGAGLGAVGGGYLGNIASRALLDDSSHSKQDEKKKKEETKEAFMGAAGKAIASGIGAAGNAIASGARKFLSTNIGNNIASAADDVGRAAFGTPGRAAATAAAGGTAAGVGLGMAEQNRINNQMDYQRQRMAQQPVAPQPAAPQQPKVAAFLFGAQLGAKVANNPAPTMSPPRLSNAGAAGMQAQNAQQRLGGENYAKFRAAQPQMAGAVNSAGSPGAGPSVQLTPQMQASRDNLMNEVQFAQQNANKFQGNSQAAFSRIHDLRGTPEYNKTMGKQMAQNGQFDEMAQQAQQQHGINVSPDTLRQSWTQHFSKYGPEGQKPGTLGAAPQTPSHGAIVNEVNAHTGAN